MSGDFDWRHPTFPRALQRAGYHTAAVGKLHFLQTWPWDTSVGQGLDLSALNARTRELGFNHVWEAAGKQLALRNTCDYCRHLETKGLLSAFRSYVEAAGPNDELPIAAVLDADGQPWPFDEADHIDVVITDRIIAHIRNRPRDRPFFLWGSFCSPHKPFDPPRRFLDLVPYEEVDDFLPGEDGELTPELKRILWRLRRAYRATLLLLDEQLGRVWQVMEEEGLIDNTVVLLASDHGEMMGDHFRVQKQLPWRESLTVPAAVLHPDHRSARVITTPVELTDFTATILDVAGIDTEEALGIAWPAFQDRVPCRSLMPLVAGWARSIRDVSFSEHNGKWWCVQDVRYKFVRWLNEGQISHSLFDLARDPGEQRNLVEDPAHRTIAARLRDTLDCLLSSTPAAQLSWAGNFLQTAGAPDGN